jgi:hypothetical protein
MNEVEIKVLGMFAGVFLDVARMPAQALLFGGGCLGLWLLRRLPGGKKAVSSRRSSHKDGGRL